ncbi:serine/threonine-protein kinase STY13-like [Tasmannia lanceolata]|uniref:serine/threonine-protein kinase STY13-like n=1 Tax=Tasmannia lanceolata TaxID=3420 RepID=UPI0040641400
MNMREENHKKQRKTFFGSRPSPLLESPVGSKRLTQQRKYCNSFHDCMGLSSSTLSQTSQPPMSKDLDLELQLVDLERELRRQKELTDIYKARLERLQDYLNYCLNVAQENGFLGLIYNNQQHSPPSDDFNLNTSPQQLPVTPYDPQLAAIRDQAKHGGWYIEPDEIELHEQVGQGTTADIYRGTWRGLDVAVKCIYPQIFQSNESSGTWFAQELETLSRQRHPFILRLMGACLEPPKKGWLITEFLSGRTLKEWLHGHMHRQAERQTPLPPLEERIEKGLEIAQAMQYLHEQKPKVVHRDLKPSNIFLDDTMHVRVADFGHACCLSGEELALSGETGTYVYMAPEVIRCEPYDEKCDVYSFGIILNELISGQHPYIDSNYAPMKIALEVGAGNLRPTLPADDGQLKELIDLICHSWDGHASTRPSFATITNALRKIQGKLSKPELNELLIL